MVLLSLHCARHQVVAAWCQMRRKPTSWMSKKLAGICRSCRWWNYMQPRDCLACLAWTCRPFLALAQDVSALHWVAVAVIIPFAVAQYAAPYRIPITQWLALLWTGRRFGKAGVGSGSQVPGGNRILVKFMLYWLNPSFLKATRLSMFFRGARELVCRWRLDQIIQSKSIQKYLFHNHNCIYLGHSDQELKACVCNIVYMGRVWIGEWGG